MEVQMAHDHMIDLSAAQAGFLNCLLNPIFAKTEDASRLGIKLLRVTTAGFDQDILWTCAGTDASQKQAIVTQQDTAHFIGRSQLAPEHARDDSKHGTTIEAQRT